MAPGLNLKTSFMTAKSFKPVVEPQDAPLERRAGPPRHILVVDDEPLIRQLYAEVLTDAGYQVDGAEDGADAWDTLQKKHYDLVITDNEMPKVSGLELLEMLHAARMNLPVIMATGTFPKEEFTRRPWLQPDITLIKPFILAEFVLAVDEVLDANHIVREAAIPPAHWHVQPLANRQRI